MAKMQLQQIKTFFIENYGQYKYNDVDSDVNLYVIERYNETGNYPKIKTNSKFISVISNVLVEIKNR